MHKLFFSRYLSTYSTSSYSDLIFEVYVRQSIDFKTVYLLGNLTLSIFL